jgi:hypothetical protein
MLRCGPWSVPCRLLTIRALVYGQVSARTQVAPFSATGAVCVGLAPVAITVALQSLSDNTVIFMNHY